MAYAAMLKQQAVELIRRNDGVINDPLIAVIRETLGVEVAPRTLYNWYRSSELQNAENADLHFADKKKTANETPVGDGVKPQIALDAKLEKAAHRFVNHAVKKDTVKGMTGQQAMTSAAIAIDKMRLLRGLPTEIIDAAPILTKLNELFKQLGTPIGDALEDYYQKLHAAVQVQNGDGD